MGVCSQDKKMFLGEADTGQGWHFTGPRKPPLWPDWTCGEGKQEEPQAPRDTSGAIRWKEKRLLVWFSVPLTPISRGRQSVCLCNLKFRRLLPLVNLCFRPRGRGTCALLSKCPDFIYGHVSHGFTHGSRGPFWCLFPTKALENADSCGT